jgi:hypothetical protein
MKSVGAGPTVGACRLALPATASSGYSRPAILGRSRNFQRKIIFLSAIYRDSGTKAELIPNCANGCAETRGIRERCSVNCGVNWVATPPTATGVFEPRSLLQRHSLDSRNRFGDGDRHDPVLTYSLVSTRCNARSTNSVGYCFRSLGLSRLDRASRCIGRVGRRASCRSDDFPCSLIYEASHDLPRVASSHALFREGR